VRLLVMTQYFWPEAFRVNELVAALVERGHEVTVLTGVPNYPDGRVFDAYRENPGAFSMFAGARVIRVPLRPRGKGKLGLVLNYWSFVFWGSVLGPWRLRRQRFDAIFFFEVSPITAVLPALILRRRKRAPLLLWVLDLWPETLSAIGVVRSPLLLGFVGRLVSFIYKRCDRILVQSRAFFDNIERWSGDRTRIRYFPAWIEQAFEGEPGRAAVAPEVAPFEGTFNVMFAGNVGEAQDFPAILEAADLLRDRADIRWLIVGDGRAAAGVRAEIARRGLHGRVIMLGRHAPDRMPAFFQGAGALLVSLKADPVFAMTIPGKVQSYLATGLPVLGMLDGEGARVIAEAEAGLVCAAGDARALAENVRRLSDMTVQARAEMGLRGRAYALREFQRSDLLARLEAWMCELVPARRAEPCPEPRKRDVVSRS
jgi:glycosyltransferase involved in cell wall biosynthesis